MADLTSNILNDSIVTGDTAADALNTLNSTKANDAVVLHNSGNESASGVKTFVTEVVVPAPVNAGDAVRLQDLTAVASGIRPVNAVDAATTTALAANTYNNGAGTLTGNANGALAAQDGVTLTVNKRLWVKNEAAGAHNGIFSVTQVGVASVSPYILTRATDYDTAAEIAGGFAGVAGGSTLAGAQFGNTLDAGSITIGTTDLTPIYIPAPQFDPAISLLRAVSANVGLFGGTPVNAGFSTYTANAIGDFVLVNTSGTSQLRYNTMPNVAPGGKVTLVHLGTGSGVAFQAGLYDSNGNQVSTVLTSLVRDGTVHYIVLTNNSGSVAASRIFIQMAGVGAFTGQLVPILGDIAATSLAIGGSPLTDVSGLASALLAYVRLNTTDITAVRALIAGNTTSIAAVAGVGAVAGTGTNVGFSPFVANAILDISFTNPSGNNRVQWASTSIPQGKSMTVFYNAPIVGGPVSAPAQLGLYDANGNAVSSLTTLTKTGRTTTIVLTNTGSGATATQAYLTMNGAGTWAGKMAWFYGNINSPTFDGTGLGESLLAFSRMVVGDIATIQPLVASLDTTWTTQDKLILVPENMYFMTGLKMRWYGRQVPYGRKRQNALDVGLNNPSTSGATTRGDTVYLMPQFDMDPALLVGNSFRIEVSDPLVANQRNYIDVAFHVANASQSGTFSHCYMSDSTGVTELAFLRSRVNGTGATYQGVGTINNGGILCETRGGWRTSDFIGKTRPLTLANPWLRTALSADFIANPQLCFADGVYGPDVARPSYQDNPSLGSYSIFDWATWATTLGINPATIKLRVTFTCGRNDLSDPIGYVAAIELGQPYIIDTFRALFTDPGSAILVLEPGTLNTPGSQWNDLAVEHMKLFRGRTAQRVYFLPSYIFENMDFGWPLDVPFNTDASTGTNSSVLTDAIHNVGEGLVQRAEFQLGALMYIHQTT